MSAVLLFAALLSTTGWQHSAAGLHYQDAGSGPAVVFLHGAGLDGRMWAREFQALSRHYRVVRYDLRGFGGSRRTGPYSHVDDLLTLLDELDIDCAHLVGLSLGGGVALQFALDHPDRVASLAVSAPAVAGAPSPPEASAPYMEVVRALQEGRADDAVELWLDTPAARLFGADDKARAAAREMTRENLPRIFASDRPQATPPAAPAYERLEQLAVPMLVVIGAHDADHLREMSHTLAARVREATRIELEGAGHVANFDAPGAFLSALENFLGGSAAK